MIIREATIKDIRQMHLVRCSVNENRLSNPNIITQKDYAEYLNIRGKGWIVEVDKEIVGFAIVDLIANNVWALFIQPGYDRKGLGKRLHDKMINWYFNKTVKTIWLSTTANTRAENFYRLAGWEQNGLQPNGELMFEMSAGHWREINKRKLN
jgi:GNAT superfamily N-acetyltransferase